MSPQEDLGAIARAIIDSSRYMTLGTADDDGRPWASPCSTRRTTTGEFFWISSPQVTHSRNIAARPQVGIVIFDSQAAPGAAQPVYISARAEQLEVTDLDRGLDVYPGPAERGGETITAEELQSPATYRLYRATASQHSMLCPRELGQPCAEHGRAFDHRTTVDL